MIGCHRPAIRRGRGSKRPIPCLVIGAVATVWSAVSPDAVFADSAVVVVAADDAADRPADALTATVSYERDIRPMLDRHCVDCHGLSDQNAGLRLDTARGAWSGGNSGAAVVAHASGESLLMHAVLGTHGAARMPPDGDPLSREEIDLLQRWIDGGARFPENEVTPPLPRKSSDHWAFQPITAASPPDVRQQQWTLHPLDRFVLSELEGRGMSPSADADRITLCRRIHLDLLGLPPTPEFVAEYLADESPLAVDRMIDRVLSSPHYGERWGRDWLDAARYADSNGFTRDMPRTIWKYRDWVIDAFNANLPFSRFVIEQLAGDLLEQPTLEQLVATGFHRNTLINEEGGTNPEQFRVEAVVDRVSTTGTLFLGLSVGCAQCHDHKYDPISQREFYQLFAIFNSTTFVPGDPASPRMDVPTAEQIRRGDPQRKQQIRQQIRELEQQLKDQADAIQQAQDAWEKTLTMDMKAALPFQVKNAVDLPPRDRSAVHVRDLAAYFRGLPVAREQFPQLEQISRLKADEPQFVPTMVTREDPEPRSTYIMVRGDYLRTGAAVAPGTPEVLPPLESKGDRTNRLDLARWLVSPQQPLTPRVTVNRYWQRLFGQGIVATENDFGTQGDRPSHPALLDWLAADFVQSDWNVKRLLRSIVSSATYRQSSALPASGETVDPRNLWLGRQQRLRLDAEFIRDTALQISGLLSDELGGAPVTPPQPAGVFDFTQDKKPWTDATGGARYRRGMYTYLWRSSLYPAMAVFDFPDPNVACTRRNRSNTPLQALTLANDTTFSEFARGLGQRLAERDEDDADRLEYGFLLATARRPTSSELAILREYLDRQRAAYRDDSQAARAFVATAASSDATSSAEAVGSESQRTESAAEVAAWTAVARVLLNLDECITRE
jgi:mono/diheme cytochrome c family protein